MAFKDTKQITMLDDQGQDTKNQPVTCLGLTFENDEARRSYFTEELRKRLPELKQMEGYPIGEDEDILAISDPPYYTACPNPFIPDFIKQWEDEKRELYGDEEEEYHREPFAADVAEGKNDPIYNAHSYHTKVPHKAIMRYILHYTKPDDIVFDGFCGTGMTGVAAQMCGIPDPEFKLQIEQEMGQVKWGARKAILCDLSPAATFIAYNYNNPVNLIEFEREARWILDEVEKECGWMYETQHTINGKVQKDLGGKCIIGRINYTVWSDVFVCPQCSQEVVFWHGAVDKKKGKVKDEFSCPHCSSLLNKRNMERAWVTKYDKDINETIRQVKQLPVLINYSVDNKRYKKEPDQFDFDLIEKIENVDIRYWYPADRIEKGDKTGEPLRIGITHVHHFYTKRNISVLAKIFSSTINSKFRNYYLSAAKDCLSYATKMIKINVQRLFNGGGQFMGSVTGTLYIPSLNAEQSILASYVNKIKKIRQNYKNYSNNNRLICISSQSITNIFKIPSSVDYIFTDPPFGSNLMYSELNFLWESWLKVITNNKKEAIVNKSQRKSLLDYNKLMLECFQVYYRILKPSRWMTVEFSNSQASVWNAIREALERAGFVIANVAALDKKQGSFKAVTTTTAVKQDLVISAYKPSEDMINEIKKDHDSEESSWAFVKQHLQQLPIFIGKKGEAELIVERTPRVLFDRMVAYHVQNGLTVPISSAEFQIGVVQRFPMRDGMAFLESQVAEYDKKRILAKEFMQMNLFVSDENSAIEWLRQQLMIKPQTRQDLHPNFMKEIQHIAKHEKLPELDELLEQNFLEYDGTGPVHSQIHSYLSTNFKEMRDLDKEDPRLQTKAKHRWYVPDPNKQADLEKLREKSLLREFASYMDEMKKSKKKLKQFRTEAIRAGFKKAWGDKDYQIIVDIGQRLPESILQEDDKLLMYYDNAQIRLGM